MFPYSANTPFYIPTFYLGNPQLPSVQYFNPSFFSYGMMQQQPPSQNFNQLPPQQISNLPPNGTNFTENNVENSPVREIPQISEQVEVIPTENTQISKKKQKKKHTDKPKRPLTYITQRAYYMNQKLRGKMKSDKRELRRRIEPKSSKRSAEIQKKKQINKKSVLKLQKKKASSKVSPNEFKKLSEKQRPKSAWVYVETSAQLPFLLQSGNKLVEFISKKKFNLLKRQLS